jgi:hypothetical protein
VARKGHARAMSGLPPFPIRRAPPEAVQDQRLRLWAYSEPHPSQPHDRPRLSRVFSWENGIKKTRPAAPPLGVSGVGLGCQVTRFWPFLPKKRLISSLFQPIGTNPSLCQAKTSAKSALRHIFGMGQIIMHIIIIHISPFKSGNASLL